MPEIRDVLTMQKALADLGARPVSGPGRVSCHARAAQDRPSPEICQHMRASFVLAGPLLARAGRAELPVPGGDKIGRRPLDTHVEAFRALGAEVDVRPDRYVMQRAARPARRRSSS